VKAAFVSPEPSAGPWGSLVHSRTTELCASLQELGVAVRQFRVEAFGEDPAGQLRELHRFGPDLVTAPNFGYLLLAARAEPALLRLPCPTVTMWDDPLGAMVNVASYDDDSWGRAEAAEKRGAPGGALRWLSSWLTRARPASGGQLPAPALFRQLTANPALHHVAWDSGHVDAFASLGLAPGRVHWQPVPTYAPFLKAGERPASPTIDVAFCGNIYLGSMRKSPFRNDPFFRDLTLRIAKAKVAAPGCSTWDVLLGEVGRLPRGVRVRRRLFTDRPEFWRYYLFVAWQALNTLVRLEILSGVRRPVSVFGLFADAETPGLLGQYPNLRFEGNREHFAELPQTLASVKVNVCVCNGLVYQGTPSKLIDCLASGGFVLCDPKADLVRLFGPRAEKIFFRSVAELNDKIEYYLAHPAERADLVAEFRDTIRRRCTTRAFFERVLGVARGVGRGAA
jgi:Glycosyl transferases group 1